MNLIEQGDSFRAVYRSEMYLDRIRAIPLTRPGAQMRRISVNEKFYDVPDSVPDDTPLLWVLRDTFGLHGTKFGCGMALCGACTVHINGEPTRSCSFPIVAVTDALKITTIEGNHSPEGMAIKAAWIDQNVPQCGYCQSGQIMSATALLVMNRHPSDADINTAMSGNICRCGTYPRIRSAIKSAASSLAKEV